MTPVPGGRLARWSPYLLAALLTTTGTLHFVVPRTFATIVPPQLPEPLALVYLSGAAELACAAGLVVPRTRRLAGWATAALFVAVFPGNVHQWRAQRPAPMLRTDRARLIRLFLQPVLVAWALWSTLPEHHR